MTVRLFIALSRLQRLFVGVLLAAIFMTAGKLNAQNQNYGALFLLLPMGAHAVGLSEAVVADSSLGSEGIWWNPASLARLRKREIGVLHSQNSFFTSDMLSVAFPSKIFGTIAAGANIVNYGDGQATDITTGAVIGTITNHDYLLVASYATPIGKRLSFGISAKLVLRRFICSGCTTNPGTESSTNAVDLGAQYALPTRLPITVGLSVRNLGQPLQTKDAEQADPIPPVIQFGARVRIPIAALDSNDTSLDIQSDVFSSPAYSGPSIRFGATLTYSKDYALRVGYKSAAGTGDNSNGFSVGLGVAKGAFALDFARRFDATSQLGGAPTYVSLRVLF